MKLTERYTDKYYASLLEIKNDFNVMGSHIIIDEIERYREKYRQYFYFQNQKLSIVLTPKIKQLMNVYYEYDEEDVLHPLIQVFMLRNQIDLCKKCIEYYQLHDDYIQTFNYIYSFEEDITKSFLEWLEHLPNYDFMKVIHYEYKIKELSYKQKYFLLKHDSYFSTIEYQNELHVSYETARLHLCYLYKLGIISRHKVGKKNVYKGVL